MVIVVSLIKIAASNENIECFREYFAVGYRAPDPSFFLKFLHGSGQKMSHLEYQQSGVCLFAGYAVALHNPRTGILWERDWNISDTRITTMQSATKT